MENYFDSQELEDLLFRELFNKLLEEEKNNKSNYLYVVNPTVLNNLTYVFVGMKKVFNNKDAEVRYSVGDLCLTFGYVEVISNKLDFNYEQTEILKRAIGKCDSFEIIPRTDNKLLMDFGFENVLISHRIEKEKL